MTQCNNAQVVVVEKCWLWNDLAEATFSRGFPLPVANRYL